MYKKDKFKNKNEHENNIHFSPTNTKKVNHNKTNSFNNKIKFEKQFFVHRKIKRTIIRNESTRISLNISTNRILKFEKKKKIFYQFLSPFRKSFLNFLVVKMISAILNTITCPFKKNQS